MAALLQFAPPRGGVTSARLHNAARATPYRHVRTRPALACRWLVDGGGRLSSHWEVELPGSFPPD
ncbi:MAG TPA: hypothetical protein VMU81_29705 [Acetobacteraceae bacterium]|jgi:hypothetical protein|nr:hypothetical protein [Acetobacteraceae bacterium]